MNANADSRGMIDRFRRPDVVDWIMTGALGIAALEIPTAIVGNTRALEATSAAYFASGVALLVLGVVMGYRRPLRPWRWAVAAVSLLPLWAVLRAFHAFQAAAVPSAVPPPSPLGILLLCVVLIPSLVIPALPVLIGAYLASFVRATARAKAARTAFFSLIACGFGLLASLPFLINTHRAQDPLPLWWTPACLFVVSLGMGAYKPGHATHWAIATGAPLPCV
jgi:hypothetical protein